MDANAKFRDLSPTLAEALATVGWIEQARFFSSIDSTNLEAKRILHSQTIPRLPALLIAEHQTAGRGRSDHQWWSPPGCLMFTLALAGTEFQVSPENMGQLALVTGVAIADSLDRILGCPPQNRTQLKWPNDLYLKGRKCGGILIESAGRNDWLVGVGINVDIDWAEAPQHLRDSATALRDHLPNPAGVVGSLISTEEVLVEILQDLRSHIQQWNFGSQAWFPQWQDRCILTGKIVEAIAADDRPVKGTCAGIEASGALILLTEQGKQRFTSGQIVNWHTPRQQ